MHIFFDPVITLLSIDSKERFRKLDKEGFTRGLIVSFLRLIFNYS